MHTCISKFKKGYIIYAHIYLNLPKPKKQA